ncbi:Plasma kallikrein-like 2, partial [Homarus americanus]
HPHQQSSWFCASLVLLIVAVVLCRNTSTAAVSHRSSSRRHAARVAGSHECRQPLEEVVVGGGTSLILTSPNFPAAYDYRTKCGWTIRPTSRNVVLALSCDTFVLQEPSSSGEYCGSNIPLSITTTNITRFRVTFKTNGQKNFKGFHCTVRTSNPNTDHCSCGVRGQARSSPTQERVGHWEFPWLAALVKAKTSIPFCGASVISERWVLTSAACAERVKYNKYNYEVIVGGHNLSVTAPGQTGQPIRKVFIHPRYNSGLYLKEVIVFRGSRMGVVKEGPLPVCLPDLDAHTNLTSYRAILTGWGTGEETTGVVRKVVVRTMNGSTCLQRYQGHNVSISDSSLCAAPVSETHRDFYKAELGGPLVRVREEGGGEGRYQQIGVASFSDASSRYPHQAPTLPGVYTNLAPYLRWITNTVGLDNTCQ